LITTEVIQ